MIHLPLPPPHHLKHTLGLGTKHPAPHSLVSRPLTPPYLDSLFLISLFYPSLPITQICDISHFLYLYKKKFRFKYNLRTPPSTGVCLWFPPPPHPPHTHPLMDTAWGYLLGQGNVWGLWHDQGTLLEIDTRMGPCFNVGKGGGNETGPLQHKVMTRTIKNKNGRGKKGRKNKTKNKK